MSYVKQVNEDNASGAIRRVFDASMARDGEISELIRATSLDAKSTQAAHNLDTNLMKTKNALTPERRALLGMVVGNANICYYTTFQYFKEYVEATGNKKLAEQVTLDYRKAALEEGDRSLCDYAVKLTLQPGEMTADDIDDLSAEIDATRALGQASLSASPKVVPRRAVGAVPRGRPVGRVPTSA